MLRSGTTPLSSVGVRTEGLSQCVKVRIPGLRTGTEGVKPLLLVRDIILKKTKNLT